MGEPTGDIPTKCASSEASLSGLVTTAQDLSPFCHQCDRSGDSELLAEAIADRLLDRVLQILSQPTTRGEAYARSERSCVLEHISVSEHNLPSANHRSAMDMLGWTRARLFPIHYALILLASAPLEEIHARYDIVKAIIQASTARQLDSLLVECDNSALHLAAFFGLSDVVRLFVDRGSTSASLKNSLGHRPMQVAQDPRTIAVLTAAAEQSPAYTTVSTRPLSPIPKESSSSSSLPSSPFQLRLASSTNLTLVQQQQQGSRHISSSISSTPSKSYSHLRSGSWPNQTSSTRSSSSSVIRNTSFYRSQQDEELMRQWEAIQDIDRADKESLRHLGSDSHREHATSANEAIIIPNIEHQELQPAGRGGARRTSVGSLSRITITIPPKDSTNNSNDDPASQSSGSEISEKVVLKSILKGSKRTSFPPSTTTTSDGTQDGCQQHLTSFPAPKKSVHWNEIAHVREFEVESRFDEDRMSLEEDLGAAFGEDFGYGLERQEYHVLEGAEDEQDLFVPDSPIDSMPPSPTPVLLAPNSSLRLDHDLRHGHEGGPLSLAPSDFHATEKGRNHQIATGGWGDRPILTGSMTATPPFVIQPPQPASVTSKGRGLRVDTSSSGVARPISPLAFALSPPESPPTAHNHNISPITRRPDTSPVSPQQRGSSSMSSFAELYYGQHRDNKNADTTKDPNGVDSAISLNDPPMLSQAPTSPLPPVPALSPVRTMSPSRTTRHKDRELKSLSLNALDDDALKAIGRATAAGYIRRLNEDNANATTTMAAGGNGGQSGSTGQVAPCPPSKDRGSMMGLQRKRSNDQDKALPALPSSSASNQATHKSSSSTASTAPFEDITELNSAMNRGGLPRLMGQTAGRGYAPRSLPHQRKPRRGSLTITGLPDVKSLIPNKKKRGVSTAPLFSKGSSSASLSVVRESNSSSLIEHPEEEEEEGEEEREEAHHVEEQKIAAAAKDATPTVKGSKLSNSGKVFIRVLGFKALNLPSTTEPVHVHVALQSNGDNTATTAPVKLSKRMRIGHEFCVPVCPALELSLSVHVRPDPHVVQSLQADLATLIERSGGSSPSSSSSSKLPKVLAKSRSLMALGNNSTSSLLPNPSAAARNNGPRRALSPPPILTQTRLPLLSSKKSLLPSPPKHHRSSSSSSSTTLSTAKLSSPSPSSPPPPAPLPPFLHARSHSLDDFSLPLIMLSKFISPQDYCLAKSGTIHFDKISKRCEGNVVSWSFEMMNDWHSTVLHEPASRHSSIKNAVAVTGGDSHSASAKAGSTSSSSSVSTLVGVLELQLCYLSGVSIEDAPKSLEDVETDMTFRRWKRHMWKEGYLSYLSRSGKGWRRDFYRVVGDALIQHDESLKVLCAMDLSQVVSVKAMEMNASSSSVSSASSISVALSQTEGQLPSPPQSPTLQSSSPMAMPSLSGIAAGMDTMMQQRQLVLDFGHGEAPVYLMADSEDDRGQWIQAIRCAMEHVAPATL